MSDTLFDELIKRNIRVISAFAGMGKTTLTEKKSACFIDLESSLYHWKQCSATSEKNKGTFKEANENWEELYVEAIKKTLMENPNKLVFVCQTPSVRKTLKRAGIPFALAYPPINMKKEFVARYKKRGNNEAFIAVMEAHYEEWIKALEADTDADEKLVVPSYLADIFGV